MLRIKTTAIVRMRIELVTARGTQFWSQQSLTVSLAQINTIESSSHPHVNQTSNAAALPLSADWSPTLPQQQQRQRAQQAKGGPGRQQAQGTARQLSPQLQQHVHDAPDVRHFILEQTSAHRKQPSQYLHKCMS